MQVPVDRSGVDGTALTRRRDPRRLARLFEQAAAGEVLVDSSASSAPAMPRSLLDVFRLHGEESAAAMLLVLALLCVLPVAGIGTVLGVAIIAIALRWHRQRGFGSISMRLERVTLSDLWYRRCLRFLAWIYSAAARCLRTRWLIFRRRSALPWWGAWIALMGALILLPLPLGNVLPALSLVLLSLGWMYRDGIALLGSALLGGAGVVFAISMVHLLLAGADTLVHWVANVV